MDTGRRYEYRQQLDPDRIASNAPGRLASTLIASAVEQLERTAYVEGDHLELSTLTVTFAPSEAAPHVTGQVDMRVQVDGTEQEGRR